MSQVVSTDLIRAKIFCIRGKKVMLSSHLAGLYAVEARALIQAVKRNIERFPDDFMFQLTKQEARDLRSQIVILEKGSEEGLPSAGRGRHLKYSPYAFTEQGVAMLSSVLKSQRAIQVNIAIMRAFVQMREILLTHKELAAKIEALELKYRNHEMKFSEYDVHIKAIFEAIKQLLAPSPEPPKEPIGFGVPKKEG